MNVIRTPRCTKCHLHESATNIKIPSKGADKPLILFIGEAPGVSEDAKNECFIGRAGQKLFEMIKTVGLDEKWCRFGNAVRCIPWNENQSSFRAPSSAEIASCIGHTEAEIIYTDPVFIVPLGNTALHALLPDAPNIGKARKKRHTLTLPTTQSIYNKAVRWAKAKGHDPYDDRDEFAIPTAPSDKSMKKYIAHLETYGFPHMEQKDYTVYPTYHPSATLRDGNAHLENSIIEDFAYLKSEVTGDKSIPFEKYHLCDTLEDVQKHYDHVKQLFAEGKIDRISLDCETNCLNPYLGRDSKTAVPVDPKLLLFSVAYGKGKAFSIPFQHCLSPFNGDALALKAICAMTQDLLETVPVTNHNIKFDLHWLGFVGIKLEDLKIAGDPFLAAWTLWNETIIEKNLEILVTRHVGMINHKEEMQEALRDCVGEVFDEDGEPRQPNMDDIDIDIVHRYCCADTDGTLRLDYVLEDMMRKQRLLEPHNKICVPAILPTTLMEKNAIRCDVSMLEKAKVEFEDKLDAAYAKLKEWGYDELILQTVNQNRANKALDKGKKPPKPLEKFQRVKAKGTLQLTSAAKAAFLFDILEFTPVKFGKEGPSTDKETLGTLLEQCESYMGTEADEGKQWTHKYEVISLLREFSKDSKMYTSYIKPIPNHVDPNGLLHTNFGIRTTKTGRYTAKDPSLHVMPWKSIAKRALVPHDEAGLIVSVDHSQAELRVLASVTGDERMISLFKSGADLHRTIASMVLNKPPDQVLDAERRRIKTVVFGVCYGRGAKTIAAQERISQDEAQDLINKFFKMFPGVAAWVKKQHAYALKYGQVWSPFGFRRLFENYLDDGEKKRRSVNTPIQSGASDLSVMSMPIIDKFLRSRRKFMKSTMFGFVHDSLLFSVYPGELWDLCSLVKKGMQDVPQQELKWLKAPLRVDFEIGPSWGQLTEAKFLPDRKLKFEKTKPEYHEMFINIFSRWENPPELVEHDVIRVLEDGSEIFQSLSATKSREAEYEEKVNAVWQFPPMKPLQMAA